MSATDRSPEEISERAISVLIRELGFADTARFIQHLSGGFGDYTEERRERFKDVTLDDIYRYLERARETALAAASGIVSVDPELMGGTPVFTGTRVPIETLVQHLSDGDTLEDFLDGFPTVSREQAEAFLALDPDIRRRLRSHKPGTDAPGAAL